MAEMSQIRGPHLREVTDPDDVDRASKLLERLKLIDPLIARWVTVDGANAQPGSELAVDDEYSAWRRLSHAVNGGLNLAMDNLRAVRDMLLSEGHLRLPQFAHYSVLRSALEGASLALWLLSPSDPKLRIQRLLRAAAGELHDEDTLSNAAISGIALDNDKPFSNAQIDRARKQKKQRHAKHADQMRTVAKRLGLEDPITDSRPVGYAEIVRDAAEHTRIKGYHAEIVWRQISGLAHPSLMRMTTRSDLEVVSENDDGTLFAILTSDWGLTQTALDAALLNAQQAVEIIAQRKLRRADRAAYLPPQRSRPSEDDGSSGMVRFP